MDIFFFFFLRKTFLNIVRNPFDQTPTQNRQNGSRVSTPPPSGQCDLLSARSIYEIPLLIVYPGKTALGPEKKIT